MGTKKIRCMVLEKPGASIMLAETQTRITTRVLGNLYKQFLSCAIVISLLKYFKLGD